jgi:LmbE family N-acetylglucosaminyl deacetylase/SAM-dependent methyltransferase
VSFTAEKRQVDSLSVAVLSAHLDDAVLSVGSAMAGLSRAGANVRLITVLAGDPDSEFPAGPWDREAGLRTSAEAARVRREEDRVASGVLGVVPVWLPYNDEQYPRGGSDEEIRERLRGILADPDAILVPGFPLRHQDHLWLTKLVLSLELPSNVRLGLYAEQPYMEGLGWPSWPTGVGYPSIAASRWYPFPADPEGRHSKRAAREAYRSQLALIAGSLGRDWSAVRRSMDGMERNMGGELVSWVSRQGEEWAAVAPPTWARPPSTAVARGFVWRNRRFLAPAAKLIGSVRERHPFPPPVGQVRFGDLRQLEPVNRDWGSDRGRPVDRYYIDGFVADHRDDIRGRTLEVADDAYIRRFGTGVTQTDILNVVDAPGATIIADLSSGDEIPSDTFDCVVLTQTLHLIYEIRRAIATVYRILKPGGVVLATAPGISQIARPDSEPWSDHWRLTSCSAQKLFAETFGEAAVSVKPYGNVLAATAFLFGLAEEELTRQELDAWDPDYEVVIGIRAVKSAPEQADGLMSRMAENATGPT